MESVPKIPIGKKNERVKGEREEKIKGRKGGRERIMEREKEEEERKKKSRKEGRKLDREEEVGGEKEMVSTCALNLFIPKGHLWHTPISSLNP